MISTVDVVIVVALIAVFAPVYVLASITLDELEEVRSEVESDP